MRKAGLVMTPGFPNPAQPLDEDARVCEDQSFAVIIIIVIRGQQLGCEVSNLASNGSGHQKPKELCLNSCSWPEVLTIP